MGGRTGAKARVELLRVKARHFRAVLCDLLVDDNRIGGFERPFPAA